MRVGEREVLRPREPGAEHEHQSYEEVHDGRVGADKEYHPDEEDQPVPEGRSRTGLGGPRPSVTTRDDWWGSGYVLDSSGTRGPPRYSIIYTFVNRSRTGLCPRGTYNPFTYFNRTYPYRLTVEF